MSINKKQKRSHHFAIRGVFKYRWRYGGPRSGEKVCFENRIVVIRAAYERAARNKAHRLFLSENRSAKWTAPDVAHEAVTYLGISGVLKFGVEMDPEEVWWEFVDERPTIKERAPRR